MLALASFVLAVQVLALAPVPAPSPSPSPSPTPVPEPTPASEPAPGGASEGEPRLAGGWLFLEPGGAGIPGPGGGPDISTFRSAAIAGYRWGFSAGVLSEPRRGLLLGLAGSFDQALWIFRNAAANGYELCFRGDCYGFTERVLSHLMRVGVEGRVGWVGRRALVWAVASPHLAISGVRLDCDNSTQAHCDRRETDVGAGLGGGLGAAYRVSGRFAVGVEGGLAHSWLQRRDDPFRAIRTLDLALVMAMRF